MSAQTVGLSLTVAATLTRPFLRTDHAGDDAPSDACDTALEKACGAERTRAFECAECAGSHQQALRAAGCENAAIALWCAGVAMEIADIFLRNITAVDELPPGAAGMLREGHGGGGKIAEPGSFVCSARAPCPSVHLTDIHISTKKKWECNEFLTLVSDNVLPALTTCKRHKSDDDCVVDGAANASCFGFDPADSTPQLQAAFASGASLLTVDGARGSTWSVTPLTMNMSNMHVHLADGVSIVAREGFFHGTGDCLIRVENAKNLTISGGKDATLRMRRDDYADPAKYRRAEWRM